MVEAIAKKKIKSFKDLRIWQEGIELTKEIYALCQSLPASEIYGLSSQMKRSAVSVPSNIAEGNSRKNKAEYRNFLYISLGSLAELETQIHIAIETQLLKRESCSKVQKRVEYLRAMLLTLGRNLRSD